MSDSSELKDLYTNHINSYNPSNFENNYNPSLNNNNDYQTGKLFYPSNNNNYMSNTFSQNTKLDKDIINYNVEKNEQNYDNNNNSNNINSNINQLNEDYNYNYNNDYQENNNEYNYEGENNCDVEVDEVTPVQMENNQYEEVSNQNDEGNLEKDNLENNEMEQN